MCMLAKRSLAVAIMGPVLAAAPLQAQELPADIPHREEVAAAAITGERIYAFDQAAWHGTDRFVADMEAHGSFDTSWLRGFLVLPGKDGGLDAVFYGEDEGEWLIGARYSVEGSKVTGGGLLEGRERQPLSADGIRMAEARATAFQAMIDNEYGLCANSNPNTVIFPPDENGEITVYVLTPQVGGDAYPLGGHYRVTIGADNAVKDTRRFLNTCFSLPLGMPQGGPEGSRPVGIFVTHLLDEYPTEVHFFASRHVPISVLVGTIENDMMWTLSDGALEEVDDMPETGG